MLKEVVEKVEAQMKPQVAVAHAEMTQEVEVESQVTRILKWHCCAWNLLTLLLKYLTLKLKK